MPVYADATVVSIARFGYWAQVCWALIRGFVHLGSKLLLLNLPPFCSVLCVSTPFFV